MKKLSFLLIAVLLISVTRMHAQGFHLGVKAGTNISETTGRSFSSGFQWGFSAGAFAELNFTRSWGLQPELLFNQAQTQTASNFDEIYKEGINSTNTTLNYLSIPVLISWKPIPLLSFQIGPQFGILLNTSDNILENGKNAFKSGDFSLVGGAQLNLGGFKAGARYISGLTNLDNVGSSDTWNNHSFQVYVGFRLF